MFHSSAQHLALFSISATLIFGKSVVNLVASCHTIDYHMKRRLTGMCSGIN